MNLTPDAIVYFQRGFFTLNATLVFSWVVMGVIIGVVLLLTRNLSSGKKVSKRQALLEMIVFGIRKQIRQIAAQDPAPYLPFLGSLFLFISISNLLDLVPFYEPPTSSLSVTGALATCVFFAVPVFGVKALGVKRYLKQYIEPSFVMLPFNIISELSRTLALAVRLFGNIMSGSLLVAVLISIVPLFVPLVMQALGLLIGQIQAYIFAALATVYIASGTSKEET
ncbi:MAG: F0F1 ATP synthase subunit A [Spirochaetia bacterium]